MIEQARDPRTLLVIRLSRGIHHLVDAAAGRVHEGLGPQPLFSCYEVVPMTWSSET